MIRGPLRDDCHRVVAITLRSEVALVGIGLVVRAGPREVLAVGPAGYAELGCAANPRPIAARDNEFAVPVVCPLPC